MGITIYFAAALFNAREKVYNALLVKNLETRGYQIKLPQRDGFEFGNLHRILLKSLNEKDADDALQSIIYYLDMGLFLSDSQVVVANLDEPMDDGVIVEITYARLLGKHVIGLRTDVRSPYGNLSGSFAGAHFFPVFQVNDLLVHQFNLSTADQYLDNIQNLAQKIHQIIKNNKIPQCTEGTLTKDKNTGWMQIKKGASILFDHIENIQSEEGLEEIVKRFLQNQNELTMISPKIYKEGN